MKLRSTNQNTLKSLNSAPIVFWDAEGRPASSLCRMCFSFALKNLSVLIRQRAELKRFPEREYRSGGAQSRDGNVALDPESSNGSKGDNEVCVLRSELHHNVNMEEMDEKESEKYTAQMDTEKRKQYKNSIAKMKTCGWVDRGTA